MVTLGETHQEAMARFGKRVRLAREELRCSQAVFAAAAGIWRPTLSEIENGKKYPTFRQLEAIIILTEKPLEWFKS